MYRCFGGGWKVPWLRSWKSRSIQQNQAKQATKWQNWIATWVYSEWFRMLIISNQNSKSSCAIGISKSRYLHDLPKGAKWMIRDAFSNHLLGFRQQTFGRCYSNDHWIRVTWIRTLEICEWYSIMKPVPETSHLFYNASVKNDCISQVLTFQISQCSIEPWV